MREIRHDAFHELFYPYRVSHLSPWSDQLCCTTAADAIKWFYRTKPNGILFCKKGIDTSFTILLGFTFCCLSAAAGFSLNSLETEILNLTLERKVWNTNFKFIEILNLQLESQSTLSIKIKYTSHLQTPGLLKDLDNLTQT